MKNLFLTLSFIVLGSIGALSQTITRGPATVTLTAAPTYYPTLTWTAPPAITGGWAGCTTSNPCSYQVYVLANANCPTTLVGSTGWATLGGPISAVTLTDTTAVSGSTNSYVIYLQQGSGSNLITSGVSNCVTVTVPNVPSAVSGVSGTVTP